MADLPDDVKYRLQNKADKNKALAVFVGIFVSPFSYLYVKDTSSLDGWGWFAFNLFTLNYAFLGFIIVPIHVYFDIQSAQERLDKFESKNSSSSTTTARKFDPDEHEKKCPVCAEYIKLEALACRYCGHEFSDEEVENAVEKERRQFLGRSLSDEVDERYCHFCGEVAEENHAQSPYWTCEDCAEEVPVS